MKLTLKVNNEVQSNEEFEYHVIKIALKYFNFR